MIDLNQIKNLEEIASLSDYYVLCMDSSDSVVNSVGMVQISDCTVVNEASVQISDDAPGTSEEQIASSLSRLLLNSVVVSEPESLILLRAMLERWGFEGEVRFVPLSLLVRTLFPDFPSYTYEALSSALSIPLPENDSHVLQQANFSSSVFQRCKDKLSADIPPSVEKKKRKKTDSSKSAHSSPRHRLSDQQLKNAADRIWSVSPWTFLISLIAVILIIAMFFPKQEDQTIDREEAPNSYLVLSWDKTGKYGRQSREKDAPVEFRIPFGVYNVLNNNSIPVELTISPDPDYKTQRERTQEAVAEAVQLSSQASPNAEVEDSTDGSSVEQSETEDAKAEVEEEEEETGPYSVTIRPSAQRQIILDRGEFLTLSENASELIFFYVSEVPEVIESSETGRLGDSQAVVYAYVNGTEVRFRSEPSLEGHIIEILNNGQQVQVLGVTGEWTHVSIQDHKGYIYSEFLTRMDQSADQQSE